MLRKSSQDVKIPKWCGGGKIQFRSEKYSESGFSLGKAEINLKSHI